MSSEYVACETCGEMRLHYYDYVQGEDECDGCLLWRKGVGDAKLEVTPPVDEAFWLGVDDKR